MRLNRVLQLTAAVTIALAASIFTISCGEDGAAGADGAGCTISGSGVPYTVTCGGVEVGLLNGEDGATGPVGQQGQQGKSCSLTPSGVSYTISCGGSYQGILSGCVANKTDSLGREAIINCGPTKVNLCNSVVFDPTVNTCKSNGTLDVTGYCGGIPGETGSVAYNRTKQYCGFKDSVAFKAGTPTVMDLCYGGTSLLTDDGTHSPNAAVFDDDPADSVWVLANWATGWTAPTVPLTWKGEYCTVNLVRTLSGTGSSLKLVETKYTAIPGVTPVPGGDHWTGQVSEDFALVADSSMFCNGKIEKFNENSWKGEYCGFASATAKSRSKVSTACGNGDMPNELYFEEKYCAVSPDTNETVAGKLTAATNAYCGPMLRITGTGGRSAYEVVWSKKIKINASTVQGILPAGSYKGEYCGYSIGDFRKTLGGNTADNRKVDAVDPDTVATVRSGANDVAYDTLYLSKLTGACSDYTGKTIYNIGPNARDAYNFNITQVTTPAWVGGVRQWLAQYCQGSSATNIKKTAPAPTALPTYLNFTDFCTIDTAAVYGAGVGTPAFNPTPGTSLPLAKVPGILSKSASGRINEGSWKGQYCTYESLANFNSKKATVSKPNAICDDNNKPNQALSTNYSAYAAASAPSLTTVNTTGFTGDNYWKNEFCAPDNSNPSKTRKVGIKLEEDAGSTGHYRMPVASPDRLFDIFCPGDTNYSVANNTKEDTTLAYLLKLQGLKKANILDSNSTVKKEYCGFNSKTDFERRISGTTHTTASTWFQGAYPKFTKLTTICSNSSPATYSTYPNAAGFDVTLGTSVIGNPPTASDIAGGAYIYWKNEYCQYDHAATLSNANIPQTKKVGLSLTAVGNRIRDTQVLSKYCPSDTSLAIVGSDEGNGKYLDKFQSSSVATINKGSNLKQYCGYASKSNVENEATSTAGSTTELAGNAAGKVKRQKFSVLTTRCGDFKGINAAVDDYPSYAVYTTTSWNNDYCQADDANRSTTKRVGGVGAYCGEDVDFTKAASFAPTNKDSWKGEYCFDDYKVGRCYGGQIPATGSVSTDPDDKRCAAY